MRPALAALATGCVLLTSRAPAVGQRDTRRPAPAHVTVDAASVGAPLSPYLYGQFIEHLGRCVYGGLWAEMLEDRKFFYPVTGEAPAWEMFRPGPRSWDGEGHPYEVLVRSPWMILGEKAAVGMHHPDHGRPYVSIGPVAPGTPAPGISQERLALEDDREYVGRIVMNGDPGAKPIEISLVWGGGASARDTVVISRLDRGWSPVPLKFHAHGTTDNGRLEIVVRGGGTVSILAVSLMPADNVQGWRKDTLALLRELNAPVYRWPGGNFVSGYDWNDGIGPRDQRPARKNPAWKGIESNDVGLHEFMDLMHLVGAEPYIAVNTGLGGARSAAALVEYANGARSTREGQRRAANGHPEPFGVRLWAVGNEMYGDWQLGHMPLAAYVAKHREVVDAMRAVDPKVEPVAVGAVGDWNRTMLAEAPAHMSLISEHLYWQDKPDVREHVAQVPGKIREIAEAHRAYRRELPALADRDIKVALDEWNYWYGPYEYGELGTRYFLKDALGIAAGLHELFRDSDVFQMANYAQTVNVIGAIKTTGHAAELEPTGLALALYRRHFGTLPVRVTGAPAPLDVAAAWTADRTALTVAVVNPDPARAQALALDVAGARLTGRGQRFVLTGSGARASNAPGRPRGVTVQETAISGSLQPVDVAPLSVTMLVLQAVPENR